MTFTDLMVEPALQTQFSLPDIDEVWLSKKCAVTHMKEMPGTFFICVIGDVAIPALDFSDEHARDIFFCHRSGIPTT